MIGTWQELGGGVFAGNYESLDLNIGVVRGDGGLALIDTRADNIQGEELRADVGKLSPLPVRWVINTHYHWDHTWGNVIFGDAPIWGHVRCAEELRTNGEAHKARLMSEWAEYADRFAAVEIVPPDQTFSDAATVDLGTGTLELRYLGRGHTDSDVVVIVPDADVVFAGDLLENGAPPSFGDSFPLDWPAAVASLVELVAGPVVPGHGEVADAGFAAAQQADLAAVARLAAAAHAAGAPEDDVPSDGPFPPQVLTTAFARAYAQLG